LVYVMAVALFAPLANLTKTTYAALTLRRLLREDSMNRRPGLPKMSKLSVLSRRD